MPLDRPTRSILSSLMRDGRVRRAYLGIVGGSRPLPPRLAASLRRQQALEVVQLLDGSPAGAAGVRPGDLILDLDGAAVEGVGDLQRRLGEAAIGRRIGVRVARDDRLIDLDVVPVELTA